MLLGSWGCEKGDGGEGGDVHRCVVVSYTVERTTESRLYIDIHPEKSMFLKTALKLPLTTHAAMAKAMATTIHHPSSSSNLNLPTQTHWISSSYIHIHIQCWGKKSPFPLYIKYIYTHQELLSILSRRHLLPTSFPLPPPPPSFVKKSPPNPRNPMTQSAEQINSLHQDPSLTHSLRSPKKETIQENVR